MSEKSPLESGSEAPGGSYLEKGNKVSKEPLEKGSLAPEKSPSESGSIAPEGSPSAFRSDAPFSLLNKDLIREIALYLPEKDLEKIKEMFQDDETFWKLKLKHQYRINLRNVYEILNKVLQTGDLDTIRNYGLLRNYMEGNKWSMSIIGKIIDKGISPEDANIKDSNSETMLIYIARVGNSDYNTPSYIQSLIAYGADVNIKNDKGSTALMISFECCPSVAKLLINAENIDLDAQSNLGTTALMFATIFDRKNQNYNLVKELIDAKANINMQNKKCWTALMMAARYSNNRSTNRAVKLLLEANADVNIQAENGRTALSMSSQYTNTESSLNTIKLLLQAKAQVNMRDNNGWTALMAAARYSNTTSNYETVKMLIDASVDMNIRGEQGWTALMIAAKNSNQDSNYATVKTLIDSGADLNLVNEEGQTALMLACLYLKDGISADTVIEPLLKSDVNAKDFKGYSALAYILDAGLNITVVDKMLSYGADINTTNKDQMTVLMLAVKSSSIDTVGKILQRPKIDFTLKNKKGLTAYDLAMKKHGLRNPITMLIKAYMEEK